MTRPVISMEFLRISVRRCVISFNPTCDEKVDDRS
jgi:hypothetical protein